MLKFNYEDRGDFVEKNKKKEKIDLRKYINYVLMMIVVVLISIIAVKLYHTYKDNKLGESVFSRITGTIQYDDIENATSEMSTDSFILVSYTKNEDVKRFEEKLKDTVVEHEMQSNFYYLDATELMLDDEYVDSINKKFKLEDHLKITELPALLYYKEGKLMTTITSTKTRMIQADDFDKLLDSYEILERK